jgi:hemoglobin
MMRRGFPDMSLFEDLGGDDAIKAALDHFYGKVLADDRISRFFEGIDVDEVKAKQADFLAMAFGGPNRYDGRDLRAAHARPRARGLEDSSFEVFMGHFRDTLEELGVDRGRVDEVMTIAYTGKDDVLGR